LYFTEGPHQPFVQTLEEWVSISSWWIILGILSSIGLGTGLHTFVLYLGPYIAKVTMAAFECNSVQFLTYGPNQFICPSVVSAATTVTLWQILRKVQFEAFLWGAGTAIGELPPYFVARAARLAGESVSELDELEQGIVQDSFFSKTIAQIKRIMFSLLGNLGFFGILMFASIPNPLFDLAGITCGHFLVPFWTFFGATLIGKAVIKSHIQTIFVITMFSKTLLAKFISLLEYSLPFLKGTIDEYFQKERAKLHRSSGVGNEKLAEKSLLSYLWDAVLVSMLLYFVISFINSSVQSYLQKIHQEEVDSLEKKLRKK